MKKSIEKDRKKRLCFLQYESSRKVLKAISHDSKLPFSLRLKASLSLSDMPKSSSPTQIRKRCVLTGRGRFILGRYNVSRVMIRQLARNGFIPGLRKSSW